MMKRDTTRSNIVKATLEIFSREDFDSGTMRSIAKKARIVPSNIYKYFKNKDELLSAVLDIVAERILAGAKPEATDVDTTRDKIYALTMYYLDYYQSNPGLAYLIYGRNILQHWYECNTIYNRARELGNILVDIIVDGQKVGDVRQDVDMHLISHIYHGGLRNLVTSWLYHNRDFNLTDSARSFSDTIYYSVSAIVPSTGAVVCPYYKKHVDALT